MSEHRRLRAELIRRWKPWERSTGPKSPAGKAKVSRTADKGGSWQFMSEIRRLLRKQDQTRRQLVEQITAPFNLATGLPADQLVRLKGAG